MGGVCGSRQHDQACALLCDYTDQKGIQSLIRKKRTSFQYSYSALCAKYQLSYILLYHKFFSQKGPVGISTRYTYTMGQNTRNRTVRPELYIFTLRVTPNITNFPKSGIFNMNKRRHKVTFFDNWHKIGEFHSHFMKNMAITITYPGKNWLQLIQNYSLVMS